MSTTVAIAPNDRQITEYEELAQRSADGIDVSLLWRRGTDAVAIAVTDSRTGAEFTLAIPGDRALDAFNHPYAYASLGHAA